MSTFTDVLVRHHGDQTFFSFRSGLSVYNEVFADGSLRSLGWNLAGYVSALDVLPKVAGRARTASFQLQVGAADLISGWELVAEASEPSATGLAHRIELRHTRQPVAVVVRTELDGTGVLARTLELTNTGEEHLPISHVAVWSGLLWTPATGAGLHNPPSPVDVGYMRDSRWGREGDFAWQELPESELVVAARTHRPPYRHPMFVARVRDGGEHFIGQLAWSGGYELAFDYERYDAASQGSRLPWLSFRASMDAPAPQIVLAAGESIPTATMHLGGVIGELDQAVDAMTAHIRTSVVPREPERLGHIQGGIGPEQEINTASVIHEMDAHARIGIDTFYIDANWYSPPGGNWFATVGDWHVDPQRFPGGMSEIREAAHARGMRFGLWMEPERLGEQSQARQEHTDLLAVDYRGSQDNGRIDLGDDAAAAWVLDQIRSVIGGLELDFFRIDFNNGYLIEGFWRERGGHQENHYWRYYLGHYRIFAQLRAEFPDVTFQNCAGGGARTDLGMVAGFDDTWVTDWQIAPQSFQIINGMTMALPPELIDRHIGMGQADHVAASHDFQLRLGLFGRPTMSWPAPVGAEPNPVHEARARHMLDIYRDVLQPLRGDTRIHHHTPTDFQARWGVLERSALDGSASVIGAFRLGSEGPGMITIYPRGIDAAARYRVNLDNEDQQIELDGATLLTEGLRVTGSAALTSQLFVLRRI